MTGNFCKFTGMIVAAAIGALSIAAECRAGDGYVDRERIARYYEYCYGPNGYARRMNWNRSRVPSDEDCDGHRGCLCKHCCCGHCCAPGCIPPSKCLDICLYRIVFPISPWYSHPRDGIIFPAYGSRSPTCVPQKD